MDIKAEKSVLGRVRIKVPRWDEKAQEHVYDTHLMTREQAVAFAEELCEAIGSNRWLGEKKHECND